MRILFIGDVFGSSGRRIIKEKLNFIRSEYSIDFVIANAENSAHGKGLTAKIYRQLTSYGVDFITMGNHTWSKLDILEIIGSDNIIRPMNLNDSYEYSNLGLGSREVVVKGLRIRITNLLGGSVYFRNMQTNPFVCMSNFLDSIEKPDIHIVDFHSETTSEKYAFFWAFNGKVDAIVGTHTHVPTNDSCITKDKTAFICDVGMTGPAHGIIGGKRESIINKFFNPSDKFLLESQPGPLQLCSVILEYDESSKSIHSITPLIFREDFYHLGTSILHE